MTEAEKRDRDGQRKVEPPGEGDSIEDASREAVREIEKDGEGGHAGRGDIG